MIVDFCNVPFLGWDFVDNVMSSKQTFPGFAACQYNRYMRHDPKGPRLMILPTFIDWFFECASRMKISFRQRYSYCGDMSKILACDGTKIRMNFKNIFVRPIETIVKQFGDAFIIRKSNHCFLSNPRNARKKLLRGVQKCV